MTECNGVRTGGYIDSPRPRAVGCFNQGVPKTGAIEIFTPRTPLDQTLSYPIWVLSGEVVVIDAYEMPANRSIFVNNVSVASYQPLSGDNTNGYQMMFWQGRGPVILFHKRMDLGNPEYWKLTDTRTQLLIAIPGTYQLELESEDMLGSTLQVQYRVEKDLIPGLPKEYWGGIMP